MNLPTIEMLLVTLAGSGSLGAAPLVELFTSQEDEEKKMRNANRPVTPASRIEFPEPLTAEEALALIALLERTLGPIAINDRDSRLVSALGKLYATEVSK